MQCAFNLVQPKCKPLFTINCTMVQIFLTSSKCLSHLKCLCFHWFNNGLWLWIQFLALLCFESLSAYIRWAPTCWSLKVVNMSPSAESNNLLYCLHRGEYQQRTSISPWIQVEFTLLNSSGPSSELGGDIVFQPRWTWFGWWIGLELWKLIG